MPVGAGTPRLQQLSLRGWEAFEAWRTRRTRAVLYHCALKLRPGEGEQFTLELAPAFIRDGVAPLASGPVGLRFAGRWRLFRYELKCLPVDRLPDEQWAVDSPIAVSDDPAVARQLIALAPTVPTHTWGRRVRGTHEMWTSDSVVPWLLTRAGIATAGLGPLPGGRAPGWQAGLDLAHRQA
ncbi:MAG: hypothetical protein IT303_15595 [Dehalococcoidia bacterium]|nr:hypothetical protein [Dehalococcoidia bacterium]